MARRCAAARAGNVDLTDHRRRVVGRSGIRRSGRQAGRTSSTRRIYDSFTITVLLQIEDLGFCKKGEGGRFVADGNLISGVGKLPFNTDGGGLCNNHPGQSRRHDESDRGGAPAARRGASGGAGEGLRPRAGAGHGGNLASRHGSSTVILERQ